MTLPNFICLGYMEAPWRFPVNHGGTPMAAVTLEPNWGSGHWATATRDTEGWWAEEVALSRLMTIDDLHKNDLIYVYIYDIYVIYLYDKMYNYIYMPIYHVYSCIFVDIMYVYFIYTNEAYSDTVCWIICVHFIFRRIETYRFTHT